jgi:hypothetical protein
MNKPMTTAMFCMALLLGGLSSCTTNDVEDIQGDGEQDLYEIKDRALGEYLVYNCSRTDENKLPYEMAVAENGKFYLNTQKAATVENLYLVKNDAQISKLESAGLATAAVKIVDMDGLQFFTALKTLKITSNSVERMDLTALTQLETVEMNNNCVATLDLSQNTKLVRFRYGGNTTTTDTSTKLSTISFANNNVIEHIYLKNQNLQENGFTLPSNYSALKELDLSNNPAAPFAIPEDLMNQLTTAVGVVADSEGGGDEDGELFTIPDQAFGEYLYYLSTTAGKLPQGLVVKEGNEYQLDKTIAATVTSVNVNKMKDTITELQAAGLTTAETLISSADGLQFFIGLVEFTATSNKFTEALPITGLSNLEVLQVNTAGVSSLDLSGNPKLRVLNCNGSTKSGYGTLSSINLSYTSNLETLNLKNNKLEAINVTNLVKLTELDLSGNPGANFKIPAGIFNNLTTTKNKGVEAE